MFWFVRLGPCFQAVFSDSQTIDSSRLDVETHTHAKEGEKPELATFDAESSEKSASNDLRENGLEGKKRSFVALQCGARPSS